MTTIRRRLAGVVAAAVLVALVAVPAGAHGNVGEIEVGEPELVDALTLEFPIRITYADDGHPAEEVEGLVVSGKGPDGGELGPLDAFTPGEAPGVYVARVELPAEGTWELLVEVADPEARVTLTADATGPAVVAPADAPDAEPPVGAAPPGDPDDPTVGDDPVDADDLAAPAADDDGVDPLVVLVVLVLVVAGGVIGYRVMSRRT